MSDTLWLTIKKRNEKVDDRITALEEKLTSFGNGIDNLCERVEKLEAMITLKSGDTMTITRTEVCEPTNHLETTSDFVSEQGIEGVSWTDGINPTVNLKPTNHTSPERDEVDKQGGENGISDTKV